ncbi:hypothetical protein EOD23_11575 [Mesorhizobium sp. USDA-HM6]|nr:hypothetical protein EOD23_11575 [Mesorhizobium sp. USDA-HM6]
MTEKVSATIAFGEMLPEQKDIYRRALASVEAAFNVKLAAGDREGAEEVVRQAYLAAVPELTAAYLRHIAPSVAENYRAAISAKASFMTFVPPPPAPPKPTKEITKVTKHDAQGRIMEFVREQVEVA